MDWDLKARDCYSVTGHMYQCWKITLLLGNTTEIKTCPWSAAVFGLVLCVGVTSNINVSIRVPRLGATHCFFSKWFITPGYFLPLRHGLVVMLSCTMDRVLCGHADQSASKHALCVLTPFLSFQQFVLHQIFCVIRPDEPLLSMRISESWVAMTLVPVHQLSIFGPRLLWTKH